MMPLDDCQIGRFLLGPPGLLLVSLAIFLQFALFYAILTSPIHSKNTCYQSILIIGILTLLQLLFQFQVFLDVLACGSINQLVDVIFAGLACRMTICTIELYNLILVLNRLVILLLPSTTLETQFDLFHRIFNYTCWLLNVPIWIAIFHPSCTPEYLPYSPRMADTCVNTDFLHFFDKIRNVTFAANFIAYLFLIIGMRLKYTSSQTLKGIELRILTTSLGQFVNLGLITLLTVYFEPFIEDQVLGRVVFRIIRTLYPCCNVFLVVILDRPLRQRIYKGRNVSISSSGVAVVQSQKPKVAWT